MMLSVQPLPPFTESMVTSQIHNLCVLAIFKNETMNMKVWIEHYINQGVDHFYLIDNGSNDNPLNILQEYIDKKIVTYYALPEKHKQIEHYKTVFTKENVKEKAKWLIICDLDEFFFGTIEKLSDALVQYEQYDIIYSNWLMFGSNGLIQHPKDIRIGNNTRVEIINNHTKYIVKPDKIGDTNNIDLHEIHNINNAIFVNDRIHLNHYPIQSLEFFEKVKMKRGAADGAAHENIRDMSYFNEYNENTTFEDNLLKNIVLNGYNSVVINHNSGFFSNCSVRLDAIINYFNREKKLPNIVDSSKSFEWYKNNMLDDITFDYFEHYDNIQPNILYEGPIDYVESHQFKNYNHLDYNKICPFVHKYFTPSDLIKKHIVMIERKYNVFDYSNICVLFYRGNDKITETELSEYENILQKAKDIVKKQPNIKFLVQSDETDFINKCVETFPNQTFYFKDEIRHMNNRSTTVDKAFSDKNNEFSKYYLAITIIMSKCKYIILGSSGNCSIWIMFFRGNNNNVNQFLKNQWV
jgi:hypothetical protein